jgi:hypothetical protein
MRNMSFSLTAPQFRARTKTVTRRLGWGKLKPGDVVMGVVKSRGLKAGEKVERLGLIEIVSNTSEPLCDITVEDVVREGFPGMDRSDFVTMFCKSMKVDPGWEVNRIEFRYVDEEVAHVEA